VLLSEVRRSSFFVLGSSPALLRARSRSIRPCRLLLPIHGGFAENAHNTDGRGRRTASSSTSYGGESSMLSVPVSEHIANAAQARLGITGLTELIV
jgi:hypothetical protein